jgi:carnitine O-acetyltransferase
LCKNQFYYFPVLWPESQDVAVDETDILDILTAVHKHASQLDPFEASQSAIGVLTSLPRSEWAIAREEMCHSEANKAALRVIDSALFVLVLDDFAPDSVHNKASNFLHGTHKMVDTPKGTIQVGSCMNRWYDKLQLIVCEGGAAGVNFEHAAIDGHTALRFSSDIFAETIITFAESITQSIYGKDSIPHVIEADVRRAAHVLNADGEPMLDIFPKKLVLELTEPTFTRIRYAEASLSDQILSCETHILEYKGYGKALIVGNHMSPDSVVQMSMLLAYYKLYGKIICMYEPVLTKSYFHGRTEAMRTTTPAAKKLCELWTSKSTKPSAKLDALKAAAREHSRLVQEAAQGKGVDRHLYALKCIAQKQGLPIPALFESDAWKKLSYTILSTSNCGNPALRLFGFGPVVNDGFGVGYIIKDNGLSYAVASKHRQTQRYVKTLESVLNEIKALLSPLSTIVVARASLRQIKRASSSFSNGFDDMFGENTYKRPPVPSRHKPHGSFFSSVRVGGPSIDLLDIPEIRLDVALDGHDQHSEDDHSDS